MIAAVVRRFVRKHGFSLAMLAVVLGVVFLPTLSGRILSPNDVYHHYDPWATISEGRAQNPLVHDPPLSYYTLAALVKRGGYVHWNPFVGGGIPGVGSVASAMLSPFALLPALILPLSLFFAGMVVAKILVSFWFAYLWLREERVGKRGAAVGATVIAVAGPYAVWWLWQGTNATALYPALLFACARIVHGKSNRFLLLVLLALSFLFSGFPATVAYGLYLALAYTLWGMARHLILPWPELRKTIVAAGVSLLIAAPFLAPFLGFLARTGYLEMRAEASGSIFYPWSHLRSFVQPYWLGDPVTRAWIGDSALGPMNNFVEATVYLGLLTIPLIVAGVFLRRARSRWFFVVASLFLLGLIFGSGALAAPFAALPGLKYTPLIRLRVLLPVVSGLLAGCGFVVVERWCRRSGSGSMMTRVPLFIALAVASDLALFAAWFNPQVKWSDATPPESETIAFLRSEAGVSRIAPTFPYLMPNSSQLAGLEDIRAHWGAESAWRDLLRRIDPGSVDASTVSILSSQRMGFEDPLLGVMNVRYVVEPPKIDIIRYAIQDRTEWIVPFRRPFAFGSGETTRIHVQANESCQAVAIPFAFRALAGVDPSIEVVAEDAAGTVFWQRRFAGDEAARLPVIHVPMRSTPKKGPVRISITSYGVWALLGSDDDGDPSHGCVRFPFVLARALQDGRLFENLAFEPRFRAAWDVTSRTRDEFLGDRGASLAAVTTFHDRVPLEVSALSEVPLFERRARFDVGPIRDGVRTIVVESSVPFLLVSSEKLTPELEVRVDGESVRIHEVDAVFAAVLIEPGHHEVVFERRIGRGWWPWSGAGLILLVTGVVSDRRRPAARP